MARNQKEPLAPAQVGEEKSWNESQWFWWVNPEQRISGFHRIAHQPNRKNAHIWNAIIDDTGRYSLQSRPQKSQNTPATPDSATSASARWMPVIGPSMSIWSSPPRGEI